MAGRTRVRSGVETVADMRATYAEIGTKCKEKSSPVVSHLDTQSVAKDLDVMRAVFDQPATHYLGFSYGTEIGATYASLFPQRTGRFVLDGGVDPTMDERAVTLDQAKGFEDNLRHWVEDCQETNNQCVVGNDGVDAGMKKIQDLLAKVAEEEITVSDGRRITPVNAVEGILVPLYSTASYPQLNSALDKAFDGNFDELLSYSDSNHGRSSSGEYTSNVSEAFTAVNCLDTVSRNVSEQDMAEAAQTMERKPQRSVPTSATAMPHVRAGRTSPWSHSIPTPQIPISHCSWWARPTTPLPRTHGPKPWSRSSAMLGS